jgi:hypothetical protein
MRDLQRGENGDLCGERRHIRGKLHLSPISKEMYEDDRTARMVAFGEKREGAEVRDEAPGGYSKPLLRVTREPYSDPDRCLPSTL